MNPSDRFFFSLHSLCCPVVLGFFLTLHIPNFQYHQAKEEKKDEEKHELPSDMILQFKHNRDLIVDGAFSLDGRLAVTCSRDKTFRVWAFLHSLRLKSPPFALHTLRFDWPSCCSFATHGSELYLLIGTGESKTVMVFGCKVSQAAASSSSAAAGGLGELIDSPGKTKVTLTEPLKQFNTNHRAPLRLVLVLAFTQPFLFAFLSHDR